MGPFEVVTHSHQRKEAAYKEKGDRLPLQGASPTPTQDVTFQHSTTGSQSSTWSTPKALWSKSRYLQKKATHTRVRYAFSLSRPVFRKTVHLGRIAKMVNKKTNQDPPQICSHDEKWIRLLFHLFICLFLHFYTQRGALKQMLSHPSILCSRQLKNPFLLYSWEKLHTDTRDASKKYLTLTNTFKIHILICTLNHFQKDPESLSIGKTI